MQGVGKILHLISSTVLIPNCSKKCIRYGKTFKQGISVKIAFLFSEKSLFQKKKMLSRVAASSVDRFSLEEQTGCHKIISLVQNGGNSK